MISGAAIARHQTARLPIDRRALTLSHKLDVGEAGPRDAVLPPTMDGRKGRVGEPRNGRGAPEGIDDAIRNRGHGQRYATIAELSQAEICDNRNCDFRSGIVQGCMDADEIREELRRRGMSQRDLAQAIGMDENHLTKALAGRRTFKVPEMDAIRAELAPEPGAEDRLAVRTIPLLGDVPAGSFQPQEQRGGRRLLVSDPEVPPRAYGLTVKGDSMDLIVPSGATVIIDPDDRKLWPGARYVVRTADGETTFKEYQEGPARLVPCSTNPAHREIELGAEPITIEGRVFSYMMRDAPRRAS